MTIHYPWKPIRDHEHDPNTLVQHELAALANVWKDEHARLRDSNVLAQFERTLSREWAIETGLIERVYEFDRGVTEMLIERGIDAALIPHGSGGSPEVVASMIQDHEAAIDFIFAFVRDERTLSTSYIKELHHLMTRNQRTSEGRDALGRRVKIRMQHGVYKNQSNNPVGGEGNVHQYCPPEQVESEMDRLVELHRAHSNTAPEVQAAWLHHRFTQIHPFQDGNGRVARALATLVLVKSGRFPLLVRSTQKGEYIDALEAADGGNLRPLVLLFSEIQKREFLRAIGLSQRVGRTLRADDLIRATRKALEDRRDAAIGEWNAAKDTAAGIQQVALARLEEVRATLEDELGPLIEDIRIFVDQAKNHDPRSHYFRQQIVVGARALDYFAGLGSYRSWVRLVIQNADQSQILFAFHGIGREFRGVLACSALFFQRLQTDRDTRETGPVKTLSRTVFQINTKEDAAAIRERFRDWMEECVVAGLNAWWMVDL